jgi:hypothetical protein
MIISYKRLEQYRDLLITHSELTQNHSVNLWNNSTDTGNLVEVCPKHVIKVLEEFRNNQIDEETLLTWIYTVLNLDLYEISEGHADSIVGVLDEIAVRAGNPITNLAFVDVMKVVNGLEKAVLFTPLRDSDIENLLQNLKNDVAS